MHQLRQNYPSYFRIFSSSRPKILSADKKKQTNIVFVSVHGCLSISVFVCLSVGLTSVCLFVCTCTCICVHVHVCVCVCVHVCVCVCVCVSAILSVRLPSLSSLFDLQLFFELASNLHGHHANGEWLFEYD